MSKTTVDLDDYVTRKATSGLFLMLGQEEKMIRVNPAARSTDLLKKVFANEHADCSQLEPSANTLTELVLSVK